MHDNKWARLLAYVTGLVNQRLLLQCEYLVVKNRILRSHLSGRLRLSDPERFALAEIGKLLLAPQRPHRVHAGCTPGRNPGCNRGHSDHQDARREEACWIVRLDPV